MFHSCEDIGDALMFYNGFEGYFVLKPLIQKFSFNKVKSGDIKKLVVWSNRFLSVFWRYLNFTLLRNVYTKEYLKRLFDEIIIQMDIGFERWSIKYKRYIPNLCNDSYLRKCARKLYTILSSVMAFNHLK